MGTGVNMDTATLTGQFSIHLKTGPRLPEDAYIEVHFPNPANPANTDVVVEGIETGKSGLMFLSSKSKAFKCWNYEVTVYVYRDNSMSKLLGSHHQVIQSRFDLDKVKTRKELARALFEGNCPTTNEDKPKTVKQWEALCEREREKRIAPLRKAQIKKCITEKKDKRWCETYWSSYGDSRRVGTYLRSPRLFDDLPECIQARKVRE